MKRNARARANLTTDANAIKIAKTAKVDRRKKSDKSKDAAVVSPYFESSGTGCSSNSDKDQTKVEGNRLGKDFYRQGGTVDLSRGLLGKVLCRKLPGADLVLRGTIVETEAYPGHGDAASHSFKGVPTESSMAMFMDPGTAYVYMTYGMYHCFNISSTDTGGACLLRAVEVLEDYEIMYNLRQSKKKQPAEGKTLKRLKPHELANGPSKLCLSFNINRDSCNKVDMTVSEDLWLEDSLDPKYQTGQFKILESIRVGIDSTPPEARNKPYRFYIDENPCVSKAKFKVAAGGKGARTTAAARSTRTRKK